MGALTTSQKRDARRLQRDGLTLREIAGRIGASREAVTLWLYGLGTPLSALPSEEETFPPPDDEAVAPAAAPRPTPPRLKASGRYVLVDDLGQWLHQSGHGRTRERRWRWEGTGAQLAAARKRFPHLRELTPEEA